jgi:hypothetical protein
MRENLETPPQQCPSIPTVILLPHTYSTVLITTRKIHFSRLLLPHTQSVVFITARELKNLFAPAYLAASCLLTYAIYQFFPGLFPSLGDFHSFLNP